MTLQESDLANKKLAISAWRNLATSFGKLDDDAAAAIKLIAARGWASPTDAELAEFGFTAAQLVAFVGLMTQYNRLMTGQAVTTTAGRTIADVVKSL